MKQPRDSYPQAFVPDHLTRLSIENIPYDTPFYLVMPNDNDDKENSNRYHDEPIKIFVDHDRRLRMNSLADIDTNDSTPNLIPIGSIGIMRSHHMDPVTHDVRDIYLADLRMTNLHSLPDSDEAIRGVITQEEYIDYLSLIDNSIAFDAFIAADVDSMKNDVMPKGIFYGNETFYPQLETLNKQTEIRLQNGLDETDLFNEQYRLGKFGRRAATLGKRAMKIGKLGRSTEVVYVQEK